MGPDFLTIPAMPESRLKAVVQANALLHAIISALCIGFRNQVTKHLGLPSVFLTLAIGFSVAFHATFLFRLTMKEPMARNMISVAAIVDANSALAVFAIIFLDVFKMSSLGSNVALGISITHLVMALFLLWFSNFTSPHAYSHTEIVAV